MAEGRIEGRGIYPDFIDHIHIYDEGIAARVAYGGRAIQVELVHVSDAGSAEFGNAIPVDGSLRLSRL